MRYFLFCIAFFVLSCNTSSTEKERENDTASVDGTRMVDTLLNEDSVPPGITNPQPD